MTRAQAIIRMTLTIGAETPLLGVESPLFGVESPLFGVESPLLAPLQRSLSQQVNLQSALLPALSAFLQAINTVSAGLLHTTAE